MTMSPARSLVFGIARWVPPSEYSNVPIMTNSVRHLHHCCTPYPGLPQWPLNQASMTMSPARSLVFDIARRVPPSEYSKVIIEHVDRVRICKMIFIYHRRENDISQTYSADNFLDVTCHYDRVIIRTIFLRPATMHIARWFP